MAQQPEIHRRHSGEERDPTSRDRLERGQRVEPGEQHHRAPAHQRRVLDHRLAEAVEEREHAEGHGPVAVDEEVLGHVPGIPVEIGVGQLGALGPAGGAGGVEDDGSVVRTSIGDLADRLSARDQRLEGLAFGRRAGGDQEPALRSGLARGPGPLGQGVAGDQRDAVRVVEVIGELVRRAEHVERHHGTAGVVTPEVGDRELRHVREQHGDVIAAPDARGVKRGGEPAGPVVDLPIAEHQLAGHDGGVPGANRRARRENGADVQGRHGGKVTDGKRTGGRAGKTDGQTGRKNGRADGQTGGRAGNRRAEFSGPAVLTDRQPVRPSARLFRPPVRFNPLE